MRLDFVFQDNERKREFVNTKINLSMLSGIVNSLSTDVRGRIEVSIVSPAFIRSLNKRSRQKDYVTDVLSYDYSESAQLIEGEIYLCIEKIRQNVLEFEVTSFKEEFVRMLVHGILHIIGYNHDSRHFNSEITIGGDSAVDENTVFVPASSTAKLEEMFVLQEQLVKKIIKMLDL